MKKMILFLGLINLSALLFSQTTPTPITVGMSGSQVRAALNNNFTEVSSALNALHPHDKLLIVDHDGKSSIVGDHYMGIRKGGDSIFITVNEAAALNVRNRIILPDGVTLGVQSIVDGYMTVSGGTNTVASANDAAVFGNESMIGRIQIPYFQYELGYDGGGNYLNIHGGDTTDPAFGGKVWGLGDMSAYFHTAVDSSSNNDYNSREFWDYPYIFTDAETKNYPRTSDDYIGPVRLWVTSVSYNSITDRTKVYYNDSILAKGTGWVSTCRYNGAGTGMFAAGIYSNAGVGNAAVSFGLRTRSLNQGAFSTGVNTLAKGISSASFGKGTYAEGLASAAFGTSTHSYGTNSIAFGTNSYAMGAGSVALGYSSKTGVLDDNRFVYGSNVWVNEGEAQGGFYARGGISIDDGGNVTTLLQALSPNTSYTGVTIITAVQTDNTPGYEGESGSWKIEWSAEMGDLHTIDSINLISNRIYYTTTNPLRVNQKIGFNTYLNANEYYGTGDVPGGLSNWAIYYVLTVNNVGTKYITVSVSQGGAEKDITSFNAAQINTMAHWQVNSSTTTLIGRSFVNDGDDIGNGTTTGIRPTLSVIPDLYGMELWNYGLSGRNLRWVHSTNYVQVKQK
jgi:hypothetical protein